MKPLLLLLLVFAIGCQSPQKKAETSTPENAPTIEAPAQDALVFDLVVEGMTCTGCETTIKNSVQTLEGVQWVKAIHTNSKVAVAMMPAQSDTAGIKQKIEEAGYKVVSITPQTTP